MSDRISIHEDIALAETMPSVFYRSPLFFEKSKTSIFSKTWHLLTDQELPNEEHNIHAANILPDFLDIPIAIVRDAENTTYALSNVCTHRGSLIVHGTGRSRKLICPYHGRRFDLNGTCEHMPEFKEVANFPDEQDNLKQYVSTPWHQFLFIGIDPTGTIRPTLDKLNERIGFLPITSFRFDAASTKTHQVHCHWALYCDNYLEGFHIPFVHPGLNQVLEYDSYETLVDGEIILQIGYAKDQRDAFDLPVDHVDHGKQVAAYYYFIFPNLMLNFYPWGLSINIVEPRRVDYTEVRFLTYVYDESKFNEGAAQMTDKVEEEDEAIVEAVQKGMLSGTYDRGRYSPTKEHGVHHFHRLIAKRIN